MEGLKKDYQNSRLLSPIDGVVTYTALVKAGEFIDSFKTIATIAKPGALRLKYTGLKASNIDEEEMSSASDSKRDRLRRSKFGFVFQSVALISNMSAFENVDFALRVYGYDGKNRKSRVEECLDFVGLKKRMKHYPLEMSGGEQQRVSIAIALANQPKLILADEPTGSIDSKTAYSLMDTFGRLNSELGVTIVIVTHDNKVSQMVKRVVAISDGMISSEML